ncbi:hypothetical protein GCM10009789_20440 [Kribbella sancticallisti]|uniref:PQQ-like domain-containing protein n=1 Tax=Kribbella sancticallisti TaxID=460087 RepID=A0ABN2CZD2_9ACTN
MLRPLITAAAAVALLAGCSGGEDQASDSGTGDDQQTPSSSPTPTTPELPSFDPPKAFSAVAGVAEPRSSDKIAFKPGKAGIVGKTSLYANRTAITGVVIDGSQSWQTLAKEVETTETTDFTAPMAVQLDGKEVIATAYVQRVEAGGTQKAHGQVNFQWIDPADGKILSTVAVDITPAVGAGNGAGRLLSQAYDAATGQVAIGLGVSSPDATSKISSITAYADPTTKKATLIPDVRAAGVLNGTVVGAKGVDGEGSKTLSIAVADGATGTIKKNTPTPAMNYLMPLGTGGPRAFLSGSGYVQSGEYNGHYTTSVYAVDIATGALVETKLPNTERRNDGYTCFSDHVTALVCNVTEGGGQVDEIVAFDATTGKKTWGYTSKSANRVVPKITTVYNGAVYGQAQTLPAVLDAKTGQDLPVPSPTRGDSGTPSTGSTPSEGGPTDSNSPTSSNSVGSGSGTGGWGDTSLIYGDPQSPEMVSKYGSVYLLSPGGKAPTGTENILVVQKAIG